MRPLVYPVHASPTYAIAFAIAFAIALAIWIIPARIGAFWQRSSRDPCAGQQDRGSYVLLDVRIIGGVVAGFGLAAVWTGAAITWFRPQMTIAGIVLMLLGAALVGPAAAGHAL
jgi:hypothetical protein